MLCMHESELFIRRRDGPVIKLDGSVAERITPCVHIYIFNTPTQTKFDID